MKYPALRPILRVGEVVSSVFLLAYSSIFGSTRQRCTRIVARVSRGDTNETIFPFAAASNEFLF